MIAALRGNILYYSLNTVCIMCSGVGYEVNITNSVLNKGLNIGDELFLYTYLQVSETGIALYGFASREEKQLFEKLISVSGVGPKGAVSIISQLGADGLQMAIAMEDSKSISKAPGIGNKTAQKIILELKDKIDMKSLMNSGGVSMTSSPVIMTSAIQEACLALTSLGFKESEASSAIKSISDADKLSAEELLALALKKLG